MIRNSLIKKFGIAGVDEVVGGRDDDTDDEVALDEASQKR